MSDETPPTASHPSESPSHQRTVALATSSIYAATYAALTVVLGFVSYGGVNFRVSNVLLGLVPILGWPAIIGQALGVLIANSVSPLGPIDLLNALPSLLFSWILWKLRGVSVFLGLTLYSLALGVSVSLAIAYPSEAAFLILLPYVTAGIFLATTVCGYAFYKALKRSAALERYVRKR